MTKKECFNYNNIKEGLTINWWDEENREIIKFYCWDCSQNLMQKELDEKTADWECNKKKLFKKVLTKAKNKENFDWPFRYRTLNQKGSGRWDWITICCNECWIMLDWDVTAYEDSRGHKCSQCRNCHQQIKTGKQNDHFTWKDNNTPSFICLKSAEGSELVCHMCDNVKVHKEGKSKSWISNLGGTVYSGTVLRANSKAHVAISTKRHAENLREITRQEWADILPVLKNTINKIDRSKNPLGHDLSIAFGTLGGQNSPHFYMRIVPKYKKDYGNVAYHYTYYKQATPEQIELTKRTLKPNSDNVIAEKSKVIAKLNNETAFGYTVISTKNHLPNDINAIDQETWDQIGEIFHEIMRKMEEGIDCHDFTIRCYLGENCAKAWKEEKWEGTTTIHDDYHYESEFQWALFPRFILQKWWRQYRPIKKGELMGSMENKRMALKLRDPETYYAIWKGDKDYPKHKKKALAEWKKNNSGTEKEREASRLILSSEIQKLEKITNWTPEEEQELKNKREELTRLEAQIASEKQPNWTPWIGLGIAFTIIAGISIYLLVKGKVREEK